MRAMADVVGPDFDIPGPDMNTDELRHGLDGRRIRCYKTSNG